MEITEPDISMSFEKHKGGKLVTLIDAVKEGSTFYEI